MYIGNGVTAEFPLPAGKDGSVVVLAPPVGKGTKMKEGDAYTVRDGAVFFLTAPPDGWTVSFDEVEASAAKGVCTVVYPNGTMREVPEDPWELLTKTQTEREEIKRLLAEARNERETAKSQILAASAEAKETLKSRLLNYDARGEAAIAAAVKATEDTTATAVNKHILEMRNKHKEVRAAREEIDGLTRRAEKAAARAAEDLVGELRDLYEKTIAAHDSVREMRAETALLLQQAKQAASEAGVRVTEDFGRRADVLMQELKSVKGTLDQEIKATVERNAKDRESEREAIRRELEGAQKAALQAGERASAAAQIEARLTGIERRVSGHAEKIGEFRGLFEARLKEYRQALSKKTEEQNAGR